MAISRRTLRLLRELSTTVGNEADTATRTLTRAWLRAWDDLAEAWRDAVAELVSAAVQGGGWPTPWRIARLDRVGSAVLRTEAALTVLAAEAGLTIGSGAQAVVVTTATAEPTLIASQLPAGAAAEAAAGYAAKVLPTPLDVIVRRTTEQITALTRPISDDATEAVKRSLVRGVALGDNPNATGRDMLARVQGAFDGGLDRAVVIARTEILDAHRATAAYTHQANADVLDGWVWLSTLDPKRTCASCWSMHGRIFPLETPGPADHVAGRCARMPKVKPWRELGFDLDEPADTIPDAQARFDALPTADQRRILGPGRHAMYRSGRIAWADLARRRTNNGWRPSYEPATLRDLRRKADLRAA